MSRHWLMIIVIWFCEVYTDLHESFLTPRLDVAGLARARWRSRFRWWACLGPPWFAHVASVLRGVRGGGVFPPRECCGRWAARVGPSPRAFPFPSAKIRGIRGKSLVTSFYSLVRRASKTPLQCVIYGLHVKTQLAAILVQVES